MSITNEEIRERRELAGLAQWQLAKRFGVSQAKMSSIELGCRELSSRERKKLEAVLQQVLAERSAKLRQLVGGEEKIPA